MKSFRILVAGLSSILALVSCNKENPIKTDRPVSEGARVITVSFSPATKSRLDGYKPVFEADDKIALYEETKPSEKKEYSVTIDEKTKIATITVGENDFPKATELKAIYPASAWTNDGLHYKVSTVQDGTFASANICTAIIKPEEIKATFSNQTAIFKFDSQTASKATTIEVITAAGQIANSNPSGKVHKLNKIRVQNLSSITGDVFVSILVPDGLKISDLSFANGRHMKTNASSSSSVSINTIYTVDDNNWSEPYIELNGLKWAKKNIGANSDTDSGLYFSWGEVKGHKWGDPNSGSFGFNESNPEPQRYTGNWNATMGFAYCNTPYANQKSDSYTEKYSSNIIGGKTSLELMDDAANANWHGSWRMPTSDEIKTLFNNNNANWRTKENNSGSNGILFEAGLFLPSSSYGLGDNLIGNNACYYWSSSLDDSDAKKASCLKVEEMVQYSINPFERFYGLPIRAVSD